AVRTTSCVFRRILAHVFSLVAFGPLIGTEARLWICHRLVEGFGAMTITLDMTAGGTSWYRFDAQMPPIQFAFMTARRPDFEKMQGGAQVSHDEVIFGARYLPL